MSALSVQQLRARLHACGLRATLPRIAVLGQLTAAEGPRSHAELTDALTAQGFDRATVYRNLIDLTDAGLVSRTDLGDHRWRFELKRAHHARDPHHPHFICEGCGSIACLPEASVELHAVRGAPKALRYKSVQVQVRGLCNGCA